MKQNRSRKAKSFVTLMIIIAVSALILRIIIENLINFNITQNESNASAALKLIGAALDNYAKDNRGVYPEELSALIRANPPYIDKSYVNYFKTNSVKGYSFSCPSLAPSGYSCQAVAARCGFSGRTLFTVKNGGVLSTEACE